MTGAGSGPCGAGRSRTAEPLSEPRRTTVGNCVTKTPNTTPDWLSSSPSTTRNQGRVTIHLLHLPSGGWMVEAGYAPRRKGYLSQVRRTGDSYARPTNDGYCGAFLIQGSGPSGPKNIDSVLGRSTAGAHSLSTHAPSAALQECIQSRVRNLRLEGLCSTGKPL